MSKLKIKEEYPVPHTSNHTLSNLKASRDILSPPLICCACPICSKIYTTKVQFHRHMLRDHSVYNTCPTCSLQFRNPHAFSRHLDSHQSQSLDEDKIFKCDKPNCEKAFKRELNLTRHLRFHRYSFIRFACEYCEVCVGTLPDHKWHMENQSASSDGSCFSEPEVTCEFCGEAVDTVMSLQKHQLSCSVDYSSTTESISESKHKKIPNMMQDNVPNKKHVCKECGKSFKANSDLKKHNWVHFKTGIVTRNVTSDLEKVGEQSNSKFNAKKNLPKAQVEVTTKEAEEIVESVSNPSNEYNLQNLDALTLIRMSDSFESEMKRRKSSNLYCSLCDKTFSRIRRLTDHNAKFHKGIHIHEKCRKKIKTKKVNDLPTTNQIETEVENIVVKVDFDHVEMLSVKLEKEEMETEQDFPEEDIYREEIEVKVDPLDLLDVTVKSKESDLIVKTEVDDHGYEFEDVEEF